MIANTIKLFSAVLLSLFLAFGVVQLTTQSAKACSAQTCPPYLFYPSCSYQISYYNDDGMFCCVYSCGAEYCGYC